jgi:hypothetical protein
MRPIGPRLDATAARSPEAMHAAVEIDAPTYAHEIPTTAELVAPLPSPSQNGRRNLGCGWWPNRQRCRPRLCGGGSSLLTTRERGAAQLSELRCRGLQRALNVGPWGENALMGT